MHGVDHKRAAEHRARLLLPEGVGVYLSLLIGSTGTIAELAN